MGGRTSAASHNRYIAKAYDRINLTVPKGDKGAIQAAAEAAGQSINAYTRQAIAERMERDNQHTEHQTAGE